MSRSHRHRVPTARPPAAALGVIYLWGRGRVGGAVRAAIAHEGTRIDERDDVARELARDHGCPIEIVRDAWAWRLDGAEPHEIDDATRDDPAVMGWTAFSRGVIPASVALRSCLNALSRDEITTAEREIATRYARTPDPFDAGDRTRWVARDDRVVRYDAIAGQWLLDAYLTAR